MFWKKFIFYQKPEKLKFQFFKYAIQSSRSFLKGLEQIIIKNVFKTGSIIKQLKTSNLSTRKRTCILYFKEKYLSRKQKFAVLISLYTIRQKGSVNYATKLVRLCYLVAPSVLNFMHKHENNVCIQLSKLFITGWFFSKAH